MEVDSTTMDDVVQMEIAKSMEIHGVNKAWQKDHDKGEIKLTNDKNIEATLIETKALVIQNGESLLDNALKESFSSHESHADSSREEEQEQAPYVCQCIWNSVCE